MCTPTTSPIVRYWSSAEPSVPCNCTICTNLHSSAAGASATRGGITIRLGAAPSFANSNSLTPCARAADVWFIFSARGRVTRLQTNSPVALILDTVSFHPDELNMRSEEHTSELQ